MRPGSKGRYAVAAVLDLARQAADRPVPLVEIARRQDISLSYLEQLFAHLRRAGLVRAMRGPGGGYLLNREPQRIAIADILDAVEAERPIRGSDRASVSSDRAYDEDLWQALDLHVRGFLQGVTLQDVAEGRLLPRA